MADSNVSPWVHRVMEEVHASQQEGHEGEHMTTLAMLCAGADPGRVAGLASLAYEGLVILAGLQGSTVDAVIRDFGATARDMQQAPRG